MLHPDTGSAGPHAGIIQNLRLPDEISDHRHPHPIYKREVGKPIATGFPDSCPHTEFP